MISVVVPAFNEEKNIQRCLEGFVHQKTQEGFEVMLVDNNCTDKTVEIARTFQSRLQLRIVSELQKGRGHARATGFKHAKGDIILSTDADAVAPSDWVEQMARVFDNQKVAAVTGTGKMIDASGWKNTLVTLSIPMAIRLYSLIHRHYCLFGFNFGIRKEIYKKSGGFKNINGFEDIDLGFRVYKLGKITYKPIWVYMSGRRFDKSVLRGIGSYLSGYIDYRVKKKPDIFLSDVRQ